MICLVDGQYKVTFNQFSNDSLNAWSYQRIYVNSVIHAETIVTDSDWYTGNINCNVTLKRNDYVQIKGLAHTNECGFFIERI